ncbi:GntR family transcriptional regulator [Micromonospora sp. BRA006-A]|nr:GntR family transcriptional regulator [Micromonospora sp. BRA006-A]
MTFDPAPRVSVSDHVFGRLRDAIVSGRYAPDETLPGERELAGVRGEPARGPGGAAASATARPGPGQPGRRDPGAGLAGPRRTGPRAVPGPLR